MMRVRDSQAAFGLAVLAGALTLGATALFPVWTNDLFGHMAAGRQIVALGHVPDHDTFSFYFDQPRPWRNHNWASCVLFFLVHRAAGFDALVLLKVLVFAAIGALVVLCCERRTFAAPIASLLLLWGAPSVRPRCTVRPHIFGLLGCALLLYGLLKLARSEPAQRNWRTLAALGVMQVAWVNLHGSGPMAFLLTGAFLVGHYGDKPRQAWFLRLMLVQALACCITPAGPAMMIETFDHVSSEETRFFIGEWGPLYSSDNPWDMPAWLVTCVLTLWAAKPLWRSGAIGRSWLLVTGGTLVMAYHSLRFIAEPLLLGAPCVATGIALRLQDVAAAQRRSLGAALAVLALVAIARVSPHIPPFQPMALGFSPRNLPVEPGRWLAAHRPHARSMGAMPDCWYLSYAVPEGLVAVDGRQAVYPLDVLKALTRALKKPKELFAVMDSKHADAVVLRHNRPEQARSIAALLARSDYGVATVGDRHVLFVRNLARDEAITALIPNLALRAFTPEQAARAKVELARIGSHPGSSAYYGFQSALLALSPYLRNGGYDGLQPVSAPAQRALYQHALQGLAPALVPNENLPSAQALATLLNLELCALNDAADSLELATSEGENRYTIASRIELKIRRGQLDEAQAMLTTLTRSGPDAWLEALAQERATALTQPRCPSK